MGWLKDGAITQEEFDEEDQRAMDEIRTVKRSKIIRDVRKNKQINGPPNLRVNRVSVNLEKSELKDVDDNDVRDTSLYYRYSAKMPSACTHKVDKSQLSHLGHSRSVEVKQKPIEEKPYDIAQIKRQLILKKSKSRKSVNKKSANTKLLKQPKDNVFQHFFSTHTDQDITDNFEQDFRDCLHGSFLVRVNRFLSGYNFYNQNVTS